MQKGIPEELMPVELERAGKYPKLRRLDLSTSKHNALFDGYSSRMEYMFRDAQMNVHLQEVNLSPWSQQIFPDNCSHDIGINSLNISLLPNEMLNADQNFRDFL